MKIKVFYSDFKIFPNLGYVLTKRNGYYKVEEYNETHMVVSWPMAILGADNATRIANTERDSPYKSAARFTEKGYF